MDDGQGGYDDKLPGKGLPNHIVVATVSLTLVAATFLLGLFRSWLRFGGGGTQN